MTFSEFLEDNKVLVIEELSKHQLYTLLVNCWSEAYSEGYAQAVDNINSRDYRDRHE